MNDLIQEIHQANVKAGWWTNLETGESLTAALGEKPKRNVPEMLCLIHSEISEAYEGVSGSLMDDKLPHRTMFEVELADVLIRIFDMSCGLNLRLVEAYDSCKGTSFPLVLLDDMPTVENFIVALHCYVSRAMEGFRKNTVDDATGFSYLELYLAWVVYRIRFVQAITSLDVDGAIREKMAYNAQRADHKIENRLKDDGKKF